MNESLTRDDIRGMADCPNCGAEAGEPCVYHGKGSQKAMRLGKNHFERMQAAQGQPRPVDDIDLIDDGDQL